MSDVPLSAPVRTLAEALVLDDGKVRLPDEAARRFEEAAAAIDDRRALATEVTALMARLMREGEGTAPAVASLSLLASALLKSG